MHATESAGDSLALNFTYGNSNWHDVFLRYLQAELVQDPKWRGFACVRKDDDLEELADLLAQTVKPELATAILSRIKRNL